MSTAVEIMQAGMGCWFTGGFNGPEKEANFDNYFSENIVWENNVGITAPILLPYSGTFVGRDGFWHVMEMFKLMEWKDCKPSYFRGPSDDKSMCLLDGYVAVRGTDKISDKRIQRIIQWTHKGGKVVHMKVFCSAPNVYNTLFA